jgi:hypothetical protein
VSLCPVEEEGLGGKVLRISDIKDIYIKIYIKISKRDIKDIKDMSDIKDIKRI